MSAPLLAPFQGRLIRPEWASRVIAGAYDSKTPEQRRQIVEQNPFSYMGVTRSHEDRFDGCSDAELLRLSTQTLRRILDAGAFAASDHAAYYAYRLSSVDASDAADASGAADVSDAADEQDGPIERSTAASAARRFDQTGIVGALDLDGLRDGRVLTHENIRHERASLISDHLSHVGATSSPVSLTHVAPPELLEVLRSVTLRSPDVDALAEGVRNQVWTLRPDETPEIERLLEDQVFYVTDGHHRCAAAFAARAVNPDCVPFSRTLAAVFPHDQLRVEAFHRRAPDRSFRSTPELIDALGTVGRISAVSGADSAQPSARGEVGVYHNGSWFRLVLDPLERPTPLASLDVERLRRDVIGHVLGVDELAPDSGVDYVPNPAGTAEFVSRCHADGHVGLLVYPTDINDLMAVAAAGDLMPPKSSYLEPKPPSGVFLRTLGVGLTEDTAPS